MSEFLKTHFLVVITHLQNLKKLRLYQIIMKQSEKIYETAKKHSKLEERGRFEDALNEFAKWKDQEALGFLYAAIYSIPDSVGRDMIDAKISQLEERIARYEC